MAAPLQHWPARANTAQHYHHTTQGAARGPIGNQFASQDSASELSSPATPASASSLLDQQHLLQRPHLATLDTAAQPSARPPRAPNPAKKVTGKDDLREAITRQAVVEEQRAAVKAQSQHQLTQSSASLPDLAAAPQISPPTSPSVMSISKAATRPDRGPIMAHRTASIDSTVSSMSSASQRTTNATNAYRVSEPAGPQDAGTLIAAAGSAEAALHKLIAERQQASSHNVQLWRLVEKQRAMIMGLNKDLEKALKEKERYRRKLKEQLAQSTSAPALITTSAIGEPDSQEASPSPSHMEPPPSDLSRDISVDTRKTSNSSEATPASSGRSDTPQDATRLNSAGLPATPQSANSGSSREMEQRATAVRVAPASAPVEVRQAMAMAVSQRTPTTNTPPMSPRMVEQAQSPKNMHGHSKSMSASSFQTSPPPSAQSYSSPKTRKAPPAPLKLDAPRTDPSVMNNIVDASDSEYEDDPESARSEFIERGRRKTREEDDREREALVRQEDEHRSQSKKEKKSKSRPSADKIEAQLLQSRSLEQLPKDQAREAPRQQQPMFEPTANPAEIVRNRAVSDATGMLQRNNTAPSLMSPGLPMSPRPGDRPPNSPMPRAMNAVTNSIPMSPKAGLPLSPRQPRSAIPLPPQTPLAMISPHLDRAKAYHHQNQPQPQAVSTIVDRLKPSPDATPERTSTSSDPVALSPGEIYRGLVTEQYPHLLLPPNALPSIFVKTASSRMRPSRASFIAPKHADENPVLILAIHSRSDNKQLWRVEKTHAALATLDQQVKAIVTVRDRLPEKALFAGHAPAKIDARRLALNHYLERMLDAVTNDRAAMVVCKFLSADAIGGEGDDYFGTQLDGRSESPISQLRPNRAGFLTKRGKNFGGWKARYFVLDGPNLKYFEGPGGAHLGSIKLQSAQIGKQSSYSNPASADDEDNQFRHAFLILEPKRKDSNSLVRHVLCAESDEERDSWVDALLQYVDYRDDEDQQPGRQAQVSKTEISAPRSPRLQKSMTELRPSSNNSKESAQSRSIDQVRTVNYSETVAGEAPVMVGPAASPRPTQTPSPPYDKITSDHHVVHPTISGPTNLQVIQNAGDWGMKPPPTPGAKDKKRSMFSNLPFSRGRSSSDLAPNESVKPAHDHSAGVRAVFGVPLAEAVTNAQPAGATTELPAVVYRCIEYLTAKNAIAEEGIFRLSGSNTVIKSLKERFNNEGDVDLLAEENYYDIHAVASLLKLYLRELPASILTRDLHIAFLKALEVPGDEKVFTLNDLVNRLPTANRALLEALSAFMVCIVDNVGQNKMNVRNLGVVFSPTLNLPGPLISLFVEEQRRIFGPPMSAESQTYELPAHAAPPSDLRSPRKQMFSDLPTPAYNQTQFQSMGGYQADDTGMIPMHPSYGSYQMAPQGEGGFGSLNDALRSPTVYGMTATGAPTPRDVKAKRRESGMLAVNHVMGPSKKNSSSKLREEQPTSF